jgi:hypothetical protein
MRLGLKIFSDGRMGPIDYTLAGLAGMTATYSTGLALQRPTMAWFFVIAVGMGMVASYLVQRAFGEKRWTDLSGFLYFILAMIAVFFSRRLNVVLPEDGFAERELTVASVLCWMILLGSWVAWRDSTLLFQAVPSIALFGLVGAFDTFKGATLLFFVFLLCLATLFARAHGRSMLKQALDSGFTRTDLIRQGPWRWMAWPEWALASAAIVILISAFGAPILQESVKGVSGIVKIPVPNFQRRNAANQPAAPGVLGSSSNSVPVGTGPVTLRKRLVFQARLDRPRYLRTATYSTYSNGTWNKVPVDQSVARMVFDQAANDRSKLAHGPSMTEIPFGIAFEGMSLSSLPAPGEVLSMSRPDLFQVQLDGSLAITGSLPLNARLEGRAAVLRDGARLKNAPASLPEFLWRYTVDHEIPLRIVELAEEVTQGLSTDFEKAQALQSEIERRCLYNLNAEAPPPRVDPVAHFLFGKKKEGYCDLFASAMVLMARSVDIPARYARGYYPLDPDENRDGWLPVTENFAHAWAELYFEGVGWVPFDPTEGAREVPGGGRGEVNDTRPWYEREWFLWTLNVLIAAGLLGASVALVKGLRATRTVTDWHTLELARNYERFTTILQRASGQPRRPSQTAAEYLESVGEYLGDAREEAKHVNDLFERALYAPANEARPEPSELRQPILELQRALKEARRNV